MACLTAEDIVEINEEQIHGLLETLAPYQDKSPEQSCEPVHREVGKVDGMVANCYGMLARIARDTESLEDEIRIWRLATDFCKKACEAIGNLQRMFPTCVGQDHYDFALGYLNAAQTRLIETIEQQECRAQIPAGLFPQIE